MYGKTFQSLWRGSMRGKPTIQLVFIYMFCNCDRDGVYDCVPDEIADATGLDIEIVLQALADLESPDPDSRTEGNEGRRIIQLFPHRTWGWRIPNHEKYRREGSEEHRKEKAAERQKRFRITNSNASVTHSNACNAIQIQSQMQRTETKAEKKKELSDKSDIVRIEFEECWQLYPDKAGKEKAFSAYQKARKNGTTQQDVLSGINRYLAYVKQRQSTDFKDLKYANGSTWFHQKRWLDENTIAKEITIQSDPLILDYAKQAVTMIRNQQPVTQFYHSICDKIGADKLAKVKREVGRMLNN